MTSDPLDVVWSPEAVESLREIHDFLLQESERIADAQVGRILATTRRLEIFPLSGRMLQIARLPGVREVVVPPYRVLYRAGATAVEVILVAHSARDLSRIVTDIETGA